MSMRVRCAKSVSNQTLLETLVRLGISVSGVEAMCVHALIVARELDAVTTLSDRKFLAGSKQGGPDSFRSDIATNVNTLNFGAAVTAMLEVSKNNDLADSHYFTVEVGNEHFASALSCLDDGGGVLLEVRKVFDALGK